MSCKLKCLYLTVPADKAGREAIGEARAEDLPKSVRLAIFEHNDKARAAFQNRKRNGMKLSDRVWNITEQHRQELELALDIARKDGTPAAELAKAVQRHLQEPARLFRRVRDERGVLRLSKAAKAYHPGAGVYRSSYKNALRLARTETNMAYRTADHLRTQAEPFVVGIRIETSNNHPVKDMCDTLAGTYPKDFKFVGWHPCCRCHVLKIMKTAAEMKEDTRRMLRGEQPLPPETSVNYVEKPHAGFKRWIDENTERIQKATAKGTAAYFLRDNEKYVRQAMYELEAENAGGADWIETAGEVEKITREVREVQEEQKKPTTRELAVARHATRTKERIDDIKRKWARSRLIAERVEQYKSLAVNTDYKDVKFSKETGGLMATHVGHNFDKVGGVYEKEVQRIGYEAGHAVILEKENHKVKNLRNTDGTWDNIKFEIAAAETGSSSNIKNALKHCASKQDAEIAVIFFPNGIIEEEELRRATARYRGLVGTSQYKEFKRVFCISRGTLKTI